MIVVISDTGPYSALTTSQAELCIASARFCLFLHHASAPILKTYPDSSPAQTMGLKSDCSAETMRRLFLGLYH